MNVKVMEDSPSSMTMTVVLPYGAVCTLKNFCGPVGAVVYGEVV